MTFKVDENLPQEAAALLRDLAGDALTVVDQRMSGAVDAVLAEACRSERRILVTLDLDFADIRTYRPGAHAGIVVLRPQSQSKPDVLRLLARVIEHLQTHDVDGALWVVDESGVRIRE